MLEVRCFKTDDYDDDDDDDDLIQSLSTEHCNRQTIFH